MSTYLSISKPVAGYFEEKKSRFYAHAFPVNGELEIETLRKGLKGKYPDARHHCYAYRLGLKNQQSKASDDGEPSHSAGDPILGQIRSAGLTQVLVVVVRYFGGTKLGVGGLIKAYKKAANNALEKADFCELYPKKVIIIRYSYSQTSRVERLLLDFDLEVINREFKENCIITLRARESDLDQIVALAGPPNPMVIEALPDG